MSRGYVQVTFEILEFNHPPNWDLLINSINLFNAKLTSSNEIGLDLWYKSVSFRGDHKLRTSADIDLLGIGRSVRQSRANFQQVAGILQAFFAAESERCFPELANLAKRISDL